VTEFGAGAHRSSTPVRAALFENGRESMTITVPPVDARTVGALIALFERAVGLYAGLVGINSYH
jgi:glucose-6-phosphate isomerase